MLGPLPVCENDRLVGMITDADITVRATSGGRNRRTRVCAEAMTRNVVYCHKEDNVRYATRLMDSKQVRRVAVLNDRTNCRDRFTGRCGGLDAIDGWVAGGCWSTSPAVGA